ncbi:MAG: glutamate racemase [Gammaproteobacteria bacterium]|nr:glutamate racemase [Gammaproteobacteria bacterium]
MADSQGLRGTPRHSPIGVFDSGVGGLTVLKALCGELPHEHFVYLGDTARLPYGTKSPETVARYALQAAEALAEYGVKCLVIACNTASSVGLPAIRERIEGVPIIGVIEPGAEAACAVSRSGHIAVIATEGTVRGGAYQEAILRRRADARVTAQQAQLFVALAEEGLCEGPIADSVARHYLGSLFHTQRLDAGRSGASDAVSASGLLSSLRAASCAETLVRPDTLVLGCTHFPMLARAIRAAVGRDVSIVDSAATTAKSVRETLEREGLTRKAGEGTVRFLATDSVERFARIGSRFLERPISAEEVELVDL